MTPCDERCIGVVDADIAGARNARLAHAAGDDRGVRCHAAASGQNALGGVHAVNVLRARLDAHQDHLPSLRLEPFGLIGIEHDAAAGGRRARREVPNR